MVKTPVLYAVCAAIVFMAGCRTPKTSGACKHTKLTTGSWKLSFDLGSAQMPVRTYVMESGQLVILNSEERIVCTNPIYKGDSVFFRAPIFDNEFRGKIVSSSFITGEWHNLSKKNYHIPFTLSLVNANPDTRPVAFYKGDEKDTWEVVFSKNSTNAYKAIGVFMPRYDGQTAGPISYKGTFMTETGDYRYLSGYKQNDSLMLSGFDGSHVFLFRAAYYSNGDSLQGTFYSGNHWSEPWVAGKNSTVSLTNPDSLTRMVHKDSAFHFSFPDLTGKKVSYPSPQFNNKVTIVQIMGSWCPNCMDETLYLVDVYNKYKSKGVEMVSLCFERSDNFSIASRQVQHMKESLGANYPFLIAGTANKGQAVKKLPMLNHIMSFPTTVYLDRKGQVRKIYTGFYGPSTGKYHERFVEQNQRFIEKLLAE